MKRIFILIMLFTAISMVAQKASPQIFSNEQTFDFNDIKRDEILKHDFYVKNIGTQTLKIKDVKSSCECTVVQPVKKNIEPGDSVKVTAEFSTVDKIGPQRHHIYILSNDPKNPEYRLTLLGNVVLTKAEKESLPSIVIPYTVYDFGDVKQGKVLKHTIEIKNVGKSLLRIKKVKTGCSYLKLSLKKKTVKHKETAKLNLKFNTKGLSGKQSCVITIRSNDPHVRVAIITVMANVLK